MAVDSPPIPTSAREETHLVTYPRFLWECAKISFDGGPAFYIWMTVLTAIGLVGANAWANQLAEGMVHVFVNGVPLPAPSGSCGLDDTSSELPCESFGACS